MMPKGRRSNEDISHWRTQALVRASLTASGKCPIKPQSRIPASTSPHLVIWRCIQLASRYRLQYRGHGLTTVQHETIILGLLCELLLCSLNLFLSASTNARAPASASRKTPHKRTTTASKNASGYMQTSYCTGRNETRAHWHSILEA